MAEFTIELKSKGADIIEKQINDLAKSAAATGRSVVQLSKALGTSGEEAIGFAKDLGVSTAQASKLVKGFQDLEKTGLSLDQIFGILQKETGLTSKQFNSLSSALVSVDDQAQQSIGNIDGFAQSLGDAFTKAKQPIDGFAKDLQDATNEVFDFRNSIQSIPDSIDVDISGIADSVGQSNLALETLSRSLGTSNEETKKIITSVSSFNEELRNIAAAAGKTDDEISQLIDEFKDGIVATNSLAKALDTSAEVAEKLGLEAAQDADALKALANVLGQTTEEVLELSTRIDKGVSSFGVFIDDLDKAGLSLTEFTSDLDKAEFTIATLSATIDKSEDEVRTLIKTFNDGEATLKDFSRSLGVTEAEAEQLITAFVNAQYDTNALSRAVDDLADSYNVVQKAIAKTDEVVASSDENVDALTNSIDDLDDSIDELGDSTKDTARSIEEGFELIAEISGASLAALTVGATEAVKTFAEFDRQIRQTGVISGATDEELALLRDTVVDLGIETSATPKDIAALTNSLSRAGFSANEQVEALEGIIRASEATGESLEGIGGIIGQITKSFQLSSAETERVADVLVSAANSTNTSVVDLGEGFAYVGAQAVQTNQPIEEIASALGLLADAGLKGSLGGTALNEALRRLSLASAGANTEFNDLVRGQKKMTQAFNELEADIRDANGQLLPLSDILVILKGRFEELETQEDRDVLANALFGAQGGRAFLGLMAQSEDRVNAVNEAVKNSAGIAKQSGEALLEGLGGSFKLLGSSIDILLIEVGDFLANGVEPLVIGANNLLKAFLALPAPVKNIVFALGGVTTALSGAIFVLSAYEALQIKAKLSSIALAAAKLKEAAANISLSGSLNVLAVSASNASKGLLGTQIAAAGATTAIGATGGAVAGAAVSLKALISLLATTVATVLPFAAAIGSVTLAFKAWEGVTGPAGRVRDSIDNIDAELQKFTDSSGIAIQKSVQTKGRLEELSDSFSKTANTIKTFLVNFELFPAAASVSEAAASRLTIASGDLQTTLNSLTGQFFNFKQANELTSEAAQGLIAPLKAAKAALTLLQEEGVKNINVGADQLASWSQQQLELDGLIGELEAAGKANEAQGKAALEGASDNTEAAEEIKAAYDRLGDELSSALREIDDELARQITQINKDLVDNAEQREIAIANAESQSLDQRISTIEQFIQKRKALVGLTVEDEKANQQEIAKLESDLTQLRLKESEEAIKIAKDRLETEKALRQAAYDEEVRQIEALKNAAEVAAQSRINSQNAILESLDDQSTAIENQRSLLELQLDTQQTISSARISQLDNEINALGNASKLIDAINSKELDKEELLTAQNELRRLGLDAQSSESEILDAIKQKTIEKSDAEKKALEDRQEGERALLALSQDQERIELQRSLTQARIAEIEAQSLVVQASINAKGEERLLNYYKIQVAAAKAAGASDAELIALEGQVLAQTDALALAESQIPLAQTAADLAAQQVADAERAVEAGEELFDAQNKNLDAAQAAELAAFNAAENTERVNDALGGAAGGANATADGLERAASAATTTANEIERAVSATESLSKLQGSINDQAKQAREALGDLPTLRTVRTSGGANAGTRYFIGDQEVSLSQYNKEVQSREQLKKAAGRSTITMGGVSLADDGTLAGKQSQLDRLQKYQEDSIRILQNFPGIDREKAQKITSTNKVAQEIERLTQEIFELVKAQVASNAISSLLVGSLPGRALGGPVFPGQAYIVGERRPELFVPRVPGTIVPRVPQASGSGSLARVEALLTQLVARPLPVVNAPATFINQPNPLQTQIELLQGQMRAARGAL